MTGGLPAAAGVPPEFMLRLLTYVDDTYGSVHAYLAQAGVADEQLAALQVRAGGMNEAPVILSGSGAPARDLNFAHLRSLRSRSSPSAMTPAAPARRLAQAEPYIYLLPALALTILWTYWPVLGTAQLAFYQWNLLPTTPRVWVGLENFEQLFRLPELGQAVSNTFIYIVGLVPFSVVLPLGIALVLNEIGGRTRTLYRAILFLPVLMAPVVVAIIWRWIMNPTHGILKRRPGNLGIEPMNWFQNPSVAIWAIVLITGWKMLGFSVLIFFGRTDQHRPRLSRSRRDRRRQPLASELVRDPAAAVADDHVHVVADGVPVGAMDVSDHQRADPGRSARRDDQRLLPVVGVRLPQLQHRLELGRGDPVLRRIRRPGARGHPPDRSLLVLRCLSRAARPSSSIAGHGLLLTVCAVTLVPFYWMFATSLKPANEIFNLSPLPSHPTLRQLPLRLAGDPHWRHAGHDVQQRGAANARPAGAGDTDRLCLRALAIPRRHAAVSGVRRHVAGAVSGDDDSRTTCCCRGWAGWTVWPRWSFRTSAARSGSSCCAST